VLLVAAASGLAPMESILRTLLARAHPSGVTLIFVGQPYHEDLLAGLGAAHPNFRYRVVDDVRDAIGALPQAEDLMAYLAGTPAVIEAATSRLAELGVPQSRIHADAFYDQA
jgi:ferredoxin-NADP reductase